MGADIAAKDTFEQTPLHIAARQGCLAAAKVLIELQAPISAQDVTKQTPLHAAVSYGQLEVIQLLI